MAPRLRPAGGSRTLGWAAAGRAGHACSRWESSQPGVARARVAPGGAGGQAALTDGAAGHAGEDAQGGGVARVLLALPRLQPGKGRGVRGGQVGRVAWGWGQDVGGERWGAQGPEAGCPPRHMPSLQHPIPGDAPLCPQSLVPRVLCLWQRCEPQLGLQPRVHTLSPSYPCCDCLPLPLSCSSSSVPASAKMLCSWMSSRKEVCMAPSLSGLSSWLRGHKAQTSSLALGMASWESPQCQPKAGWCCVPQPRLQDPTGSHRIPQTEG